MSDLSSLGLENQVENEVQNIGAPQATATNAGTELAIYSSQAPPATQQGKLLSYDISTNPPQYIQSNQGYLGWNSFSAIYPSSTPGLWIERAAGCSWYAVLPLST